MPKKPVPPKPQPNMPSQASYVTRGSGSAQAMGGSASGPANLLNPIIGFGRSTSGRPSLLGGM